MMTAGVPVVEIETIDRAKGRRSAVSLLLFMTVLALALSVFAGCGVISRSAEINSFIGKPVSELVRTKGTPTRYERDRNGNQIYVYEWDWGSTYEVPGRAWRDAGGLHWTNPRVETRVHRERRSYYVNPQGVVFDGSWSW